MSQTALLLPRPEPAGKTDVATSATIEKQDGAGEYVVTSEQERLENVYHLPSLITYT